MLRDFSIFIYQNIFFLVCIIYIARNRYNLRTTSPSTPAGEKTGEETGDTSSGPSSTQRSLRPRLPFNVRGRSRPTTAAPSDESPEDSASHSDSQEPKADQEEKPSSLAPSLKPVSRFNLRRPNQLLSGRGRVSPLLKNTTPTEAAKTDGTNSTDTEKESTAVPAVDNKDGASDEGDQANTETSTQPQTGLNRLRNRPRIQIKPRAQSAEQNKSSTIAAYNVNRKVNPLISRRKLGSTSTTTG